MAYCLRSLVQTLEQVLHPHRHHKSWVLDHDKIPQIQSLYEIGSFLRDFLDKSSPLIQERIASLEDQIMDVAEKAENTLEYHITSQILSSPEGQSFITISPDIGGEVLQAFEVAKQEVIKIMDVGQPSDHDVSPPVSSTRCPHSKNVVVGVEQDLKQLKSRLTARASELDIIPIVGMGGTGKTTLARILYDEYSSSKSHFDCCAWVTISQSYDPQQILNTLLACVIGKPLNEMPQQESNDLIVTLYQTLFSRRYLIVLDDIWSCKAWDDVQRAFPQDNQGSRIILTTRENILVDYVKSNSHEMHLINEDDSWELVRKKVFGEESCTHELEEVGKIIALKCGGLPLALQVIGGLLSQSERSKDFWEYVGHNVSSLIAKTDDQFAGIFSWSFAHLPHYLKPCFLYMGAFPEDFEIPASKVIKMWAAEGFLCPVPDKSLEEAAEIHLNALVDRNLVFVRKRKINGKVKSYGIHDLLRDLCVKKAQEKKFLYFEDSKADILQEDTLCLCRVSVHTSYFDEEHYLYLKLTSFARSFLHIGFARDKIMSCLCSKLSLLRVLDVFEVYFHELPQMILQLVNLRYLAIQVESGCLHTSISILKNLHTLMVNAISIAVIEYLPQLQHLKFVHFIENDDLAYDRSSNPHENLQSLSEIPLKTLTKLLGKLPNLRKLGIYCSESIYSVDLTCFRNLETFKCNNGVLGIGNIIFPDSLKKLTLDCCGAPQKLMDAISMLPNLQFLILKACLFQNPDWEPSEDAFCQLQYLEIADSDLENWLATEIHFPVLRHLVFKKCNHLNEIPNDIGGIETLEIIEVDKCKASVFDSARRIFEEQCQFGNTLILRLGTALEEEEGGEEEELRMFHNMFRQVMFGGALEKEEEDKEGE